LTLGGVRRSQRIGWNDISRFQIRDPQRRTPFRAIEPWHGFTALTYFAVGRVSNADRTVESLNDVLARRRKAVR